jgi:hypothetical protein
MVSLEGVRLFFKKRVKIFSRRETVSVRVFLDLIFESVNFAIVSPLFWKMDLRVRVGRRMAVGGITIPIAAWIIILDGRLDAGAGELAGGIVPFVRRQRGCALLAKRKNTRHCNCSQGRIGTGSVLSRAHHFGVKRRSGHTTLDAVSFEWSLSSSFSSL